MRRSFGTRRGLLLKSNGVPATWPKGSDGALVLTGGANASISSTKDYSSIQIDAGSTLTITRSNGAWQPIGCSGNSAINGTIRYIANASTGTFTATAPDGTALSYTIPTRAGGSGGKSPAGIGNNGGGAVNGFGGGGASNDSVGGNATSSTGGNGANGSDNNGVVSGGAGWMDAVDPATPGGMATSDGCDPGLPPANGGGGGGGGPPGTNGGGIYMKIKGDCSGTGTITVAGQNGSAGAAGGGAEALICSCAGPDATGGGGGGGSAAGSGGSIVILYHGIAPSWTLTKTGGTGGAGGAGGNATASPGSSFAGGSGNAGQNGIAGSSSVTAY